MPKTSGSFKPGVSGNPAGRRKGVERELRELLAGDLVAIALAMRDIALGRSPAGTSIEVKASDCTKAAEWIYNRCYGQPKTDIELSGSVGVTPQQQAMLAALQLSPIERRARIAELADGDDVEVIDESEFNDLQ